MQPLNSTSVHFLHWAVQASLCSHMAALKFGEVLLMWQGLHSLLGMASLNEKASGGHECLREFLLRFRCLPLLADNPGYIADVNQMIQLLTILANMTFTAVMSGETGITELTTWMSGRRSCCRGTGAVGEALWRDPTRPGSFSLCARCM